MEGLIGGGMIGGGLLGFWALLLIPLSDWITSKDRKAEDLRGQKALDEYEAYEIKPEKDWNIANPDSLFDYFHSTDYLLKVIIPREEEEARIRNEKVYVKPVEKKHKNQPYNAFEDWE